MFHSIGAKSYQIKIDNKVFNPKEKRLKQGTKFYLYIIYY